MTSFVKNYSLLQNDDKNFKVFKVVEMIKNHNLYYLIYNLVIIL